MWVTGDVDIPEALVDAHRAGDLVIFVGAGVSVDAPSSLPLFGALARRIAETASYEYDDKTAPDAFLSDLGARGVEVHRLAREFIGESGSLPNATHRAVGNLAKASPRIRLVTTNYDDHLGSTFAELGDPQPRKYMAPALPLGRQFEGLVHLHGSIEQPSEELVLTDVDFGQAYLTDTWASRFLEPMFAQFTVLFVGYSHDDTVMKYLAKGLTRSRERYVLIGEEGDEKWRPLNIIPIKYPVRGKSHSALPEALEEWARRSRMGAFDHRSRIRDIVSAPPPQTPVEKDYVTELLAKGYGARFFAQCHTGDEWLGFVETHPAFAMNLREGEISEPMTVLGQWFASSYVAVPTRQALALGVIARAGIGLHSDFLDRIISGVTALAAEHPEHFNRWVSALGEHISRAVNAPDHIETLLSSCTYPEHRSSVTILLRIGLTPHVRLRPALGLFTTDTGDGPSLPTAELTWMIAHHTLYTVWNGVLSAHLPELAETVVELFGQALIHAYDVLSGYRGTLDGFDSLSYGRSAIEDHEQDSVNEVKDVLIDGLRDASTVLVESGQATELLDRWWSSGLAVFRRLVIHAYGASPDLSGDDKIRLVLDRDLLYSADTKHEVFTVLAQSLPHSSKASRAQLLAAANRPPEDEHEYSQYNLLFWLTTHADPWVEAHRAFDDIQQRHPKWRPREYPDLDSYIISSVDRRPFPITVDRFTTEARTNPSGTLDRLASITYSELSIDGPTWPDATMLISQSLAEAPELASTLWDASGATQASERASEIRTAILRGLTRAQIEEPEWERVLTAIEAMEIEDTNGRHIADLLLSGVQADNGEIPDRLLNQAKTVAAKMWSDRSDGFTYSSSGSHFTLAINSWPGKIAEFWIRLVSRAWSEAGPTNWQGIPGDARETLAEMTGHDLAAHDMTRAIVASQLYFLFNADEEFAVKYVLPLFDSNVDAANTPHAWDAYLGQPRINERLLERGFAEHLTQTRIASNLSDRAQYLHLVATVFSRSATTDPFRRTFLDNLVSEGAHVIEFSRQVTHVLRDSTVDETGEVWDRWLQEHVERRITGLPNVPSLEELSVIAQWAPYAGPRFPDIVHKLRQRPFGFSAPTTLPRDLARLGMVSDYPDAVFDLLTHLVQNTEDGVRIPPNQMRAVVSEIARHASHLAVDKLAEQAVTKGVPHADSWIADDDASPNE
ncbi:SIR2 family protein [Rhodococcus sp. NPDC059234]|uniref:SIR2 family protein n=1 Tax=Rhodococcus sp. NPDC059234 TaxID=3346781 RepID=UPI00366E39BB